VEVDTIRDEEKKNQKVKASIRPEEFIVDTESEDGIKAIVDDAVFLGLNTHYFVHFEDGETAEIIQESKIDSIIEKGREIRLGVKTEKINIFNETGDYNLVKGVVNDLDVYKKEG
jgi:iron(III) transport system ATP-binding protein